MVQRVMLRPHVKTLKILGFSPSLIHDAVLKVLSENGRWINSERPSVYY